MTTTDVTDQLHVELATALRARFGTEDVCVETVDVTPFDYGIMNPVTHALERINGSVVVNGSTQPYVLVRKVMGLHAAGGPVTSFEMSDDPAHWNYWKREALAYGSTVLPSGTSGLRAPDVYAVFDRSAYESVVYLQSLETEEAVAWTVERHALAARHLGAWQGRYADHNLPSEPWLSVGMLQSLVNTRLKAEVEIVADEANWEVPLVRELFSESVRGRVLRMWDARERLLSIIDRLPPALNHYDVRPANVFEGRTSDSTVLIDWQFAGHGALGQDLVGIVIDAVFMNFVPANDLAHLESAAFEHYVSGLQEAGWCGDPHQVWTAYAATAALRFGLACGWLVLLAARPDLAAAQEQVYQRNIRSLLVDRLSSVEHALGLGEGVLDNHR